MLCIINVRMHCLRNVCNSAITGMATVRNELFAADVIYVLCKFLKTKSNRSASLLMCVTGGLCECWLVIFVMF